MKRHFAFLAATYLLIRVLIAVFAEPLSYPDSGSYRPETGSGWIAVSFTGQASRLWGVPLFYALLPGDILRTLAQWAISTVAWGYLAWALWHRLQSVPAKLAGPGLILLLALLKPVTHWDFALLSESLTISLGVAVLGCFLRWRDTGSRWTLAAMTVLCVWWTFTRFETAILVVIVAAAVFWPARRQLAAIVSTAVLVLSIGWAFLLNAAIERNTSWAYSGHGAVEELLVYRLGLQVYRDAALERVYTEKLGLPPCPGLAVQARANWSPAEIRSEYAKCPELRDWGYANRSTVLLKLALKDPKTAARTTIPLIGDALYGYGVFPNVPPVLPSLAERLIFPPRALVLPISLLALLVLGFSARGRTMGVAIVLSSAALLAVSVGSLARLGTQETLLMRIGLIIVAAHLLDRRGYKRAIVPWQRFRVSKAYRAVRSIRS